MSKTVENNEQKDKVVTKYDLKLERRAQAKAKEERSLLIWKTVGICILIALVCFIASFPIRNYVARNKVLFTVGDRDIKQVEYDYYYNTIKNNYMSSYGTMLSYYYGVSSDSDFSTISYSDELTFADYFQQLAVEELQQNVGLLKEMKEAGIEYDGTEYYESIVEQLEEAAESEGVTLKEYIKALFGSYATLDRIKPIILEVNSVNLYLEKLQEDFTPSLADAESYYDENKDNYDSVDYYVTTISATLPTEPTELADEEPVYDDEGNYTPSDAEIEAAMEEAKEEAEEETENITSTGTYHEAELYSDITSTIRDWLFEEDRKAGDTTVIEYSYGNMYYVVGFEGRYLSDEATANAYVIITSEDNGDAIISEYENGGANLDSFKAAVEKYSESTSEDGYFENLSHSDLSDEISEWLFDDERVSGDVQSFFLDETYTYVFYYDSVGDEVWLANVKSTLISEKLNEYLDEIAEKIEISDPDGFVVYLNAADESAEETENTESAQ